MNYKEKVEQVGEIRLYLLEAFENVALKFSPSFKELSIKWGYEFGTFQMDGSETQTGQYSIVWSLDSGKWRILSHTIVLTS